jgi:hypothetical protein
LYETNKSREIDRPRHLSSLYRIAPEAKHRRSLFKLDISRLDDAGELDESRLDQRRKLVRPR